MGALDAVDQCSASIVARTQEQEQQQEQQQQQQHGQEVQLHPLRTPGTVRRIAILECEDAERWEGYTESLWKAALQEEDDEWVVYQVCKGQLPTPAEARGFDALLVSGSHYSVYEQHDWLQQLLNMLQQYAAAGVRMYGCCFGCQALAQALGGSVGPNPDGNFVLTIEDVQPIQQVQQFKQLGALLQQALQATSTAASPPAAASGEHRAAAAAAAAKAARPAATDSSSESGINSSSSSDSQEACVAPVVDQLSACSLDCSSEATDSTSSLGSSHSNSRRTVTTNNSSAAAWATGCLRLIESHGDQVLSLPPGAVLLASSATAPYELWCWGDNVLASQFHLEFDEPLVIDKIWTRLTDVGRLDGQQSADSRRVLEAGGQHNVQMLQVVKHFMRHGLQ